MKFKRFIKSPNELTTNMEVSRDLVMILNALTVCALNIGQPFSQLQKALVNISHKHKYISKCDATTGTVNPAVPDHPPHTSGRSWLKYLPIDKIYLFV